MVITGFGATSMSTIVATGTISFDAGAINPVLDVTATPAGGGAPINLGTVVSSGAFDLSAVVPSGTTYIIEALATETVQVTQTATIVV